MARRIVNRKEKRAEVEAFERRKDEEETDEEEGEDEDEDGDEEEEAEAGESAGDDEEGEDEEEAPKKKPKKEPKPKVKAKAKPRTRTPKIVRMKVVWGVFNNSNQRVATYEYPQRKAADEHAAKLIADKRSTHFVQPVKEPIEVKKDE